MIPNNVDTLARRAASRRGSLQMLGGAVLTAVVATPASAASNKRNKNKNKKAKKQCKQQKAQCAAAVTDFCAQLSDPLDCESFCLPCCEEFTGCNVAAGIACILALD